MSTDFNTQFNGPQKTQQKKLIQKPWFVPSILLVVVLSLLFFVREKDNLFKNTNPFGMNYITLDRLEESLESGKGPGGEKNYMLVFGSKSCGACKTFYGYLQSYNKKLEQGFANGYVANYVVDIDKEKEKAYRFGDKFILEKKYRSFPSREEKLIRTLQTPTVFFVVNSKLRQILVGAPQNQLQIIQYVKEEYAK